MRCLAACCLSLLAACGGGSDGAPDPTGTVPPDPAPDPTPDPDPPPTALAISPVFTALQFSEPLALLQVPGDASRWYVVERQGQVKVFDNDPQVATSRVALDLTAPVDATANEAGLLGFAFHPDFATNGEVYVSYTRDGGGLESVLSRLRSFDGGATFDPDSEEILLTVAQDFGNHNGGQVLFGPDGYLYFSLGDGGSGNDPNNRAQDVTNLMGAMVRIDVDGGGPYTIPPDNPFVGNALCDDGFSAGPCPEIFAWGLRNAWRFSFDRQTGVLWAGDVGQGRFEEVNRIELGSNYGWRVREGANCNIPATDCDTTGLTDPITEYGRDDGRSITGGYVYRGSAIASLVGQYVFGDFATGRLFAVSANAEPGTPATVQIEDSGVSIASFGEGEDGEIYLVDFSGGLFQVVDGE